MSRETAQPPVVGQGRAGHRFAHVGPLLREGHERGRLLWREGAGAKRLVVPLDHERGLAGAQLQPHSIDRAGARHVGLQEIENALQVSRFEQVVGEDGPEPGEPDVDEVQELAVPGRALLGVEKGVVSLQGRIGEQDVGEAVIGAPVHAERCHKVGAHRFAPAGNGADQRLLFLG